MSSEIENVSSPQAQNDTWLINGFIGLQALIETAKSKPDMSVDDMLWWLYDNYQIVVGTRTIRRVFERKGDDVKPGKGRGAPRKSSGGDDGDDEEDDESEDGEEQQPTDGVAERTRVPEQPQQRPHSQNITQYQSPYAPVPSQPNNADLENQLRQAMHPTPQQSQYPPLLDLDGDLPEDEETIELQLQQIALQKREVELKLKMRRLKGTPNSSGRTGLGSPSTLYNPNVVAPAPSKRDSRSKKKIEESKRRTAERQERMLRDLERRSRRRDHLTADWVTSKDIWPLRAQGVLADLMHQYGYYAFNHGTEQTFDGMYRELYVLVDLNKGDWDPNVHDELLRERTKRKIGQLRTKMQKTGEIVGRGDGYPGFQKAENFTGEQAGAIEGDETEIVHDPALQAADAMQTQPGAPNMQPHDDHMHYDPVPPDQQMHQPNMQYPAPMMHPQGHTQYPMMDQHHMLPYQMGAQQGLSHQDSLVM